MILINIKYGDVATEILSKEQCAVIAFLWTKKINAYQMLGGQKFALDAEVQSVVL